MFTPIHSLIGGLLMHISTSNYLADTGRIFGISGLLNGALFGETRRQSWRWLALAGLAAGPLVLKLAGTTAFLATTDMGGHMDTWRLVLAGFCVGFGSKLSSGCTSGHFLCGVSRLSPRSLVATAVFFSTATITAHYLPLTSVLASSASPALIPTKLAVLLPLCLLAPLGRALQVVASAQAPGLIPFISGLVFSFGLIFSGMLSPVKVLAFMHFDKPTVWDPSLGMMVLSGVLPNARHYFQTIKPRLTAKPKHAASWSIPTSRVIDYRLIGGAFVFGLGWGLAGVCPGPAIVRAGAAAVGLLPWFGLEWFLPSMIAGMGLASAV